MESHKVIYTQIEPKFEYMCFGAGATLTDKIKKVCNTWGKEHERLKQDIIKRGIKYPVVLAYNDTEHEWKAEVGNQRIKIALELGIENIPAITYSLDTPNDFDGQEIKEMKDIHTIFGNDIINEPAYNNIVEALAKVYCHIEMMSHVKRS
jgi:hypothetical protein